MIIRKLILKNFRSYEDTTIFDFSPTNGKNIILIGGENGAGKSTIFEAMKVCFYGPSSYGYQGINSTYISKIKSNINHNAFKDNLVDASVSLEIILTEGTEENIYLLSREWTYEKYKLNETFKVYKNTNLLTENEILYFENYIKTLIPPTLFEFFFFDGEELAEHFVGKSANSHVKDALLQLCNYDTFEILKKSLIQYQRSNSSIDKDIKLQQAKYDSSLLEVKNLTCEYENIKMKIDSLKSKLESTKLKKENLEKDFKSSGGLLEEEKSKLTQYFSTLEKERDDINLYIKDFCNNNLPFIISRKLLRKIKTQLILEKDLSAYKSMKQKLNSEILKEVATEVDGISSSVNYNNFSDVLLSKMFGKDITSNKIEQIHSLSFEQENLVFSIINNIETSYKDSNDILKNKYKRLSKIALKLKLIRQTLSSSLEDSMLEDFLNNSNLLSESISKIKSKIAVLEVALQDIEINKNKAEYSLVRAKNEYTSLLQSTNTLNLSQDLINSLKIIISKLTKEKIKILEDNFIQIFKELIRKDSYIDTIEFDEDFNATLYIDKNYSTIDICNLIKNLGFEELTKKYGEKFVQQLYSNFNVNSKKFLLQKLEESLSNSNSLSISTKVNVDDFSKGEKQIYILCLIWALIKTSNTDVPFIIDTPYARIDETHRNGLTTKYLPNISKQVIILSTNEEFDKESYLAIKDYLCNEYLLQYLDKERKTIVHNKYFFEV